MKRILAILVSFLVMATPVVAALETAETLPIEPGITPDNILYPLDRGIEEIELAITTNEVSRANLRYRIAEERLAEADKMIEEEKPEFVDELVDEYETGLVEVNEEMDEAVASGQDVSELSDRVAERAARHLAVLQRVYEKVPEQAKTAILHAIEMSSKHYVRAVEHVENGDKLKEKVRAGIEKQLTEEPEDETGEQTMEQIEERAREREKVKEKINKGLKEAGVDPIDAGDVEVEPLPVDLASTK